MYLKLYTYIIIIIKFSLYSITGMSKKQRIKIQYFDVTYFVILCDYIS